jgi:hypothetical protein
MVIPANGPSVNSRLWLTRICVCLPVPVHMGGCRDRNVAPDVLLGLFHKSLHKTLHKTIHKTFHKSRF